MRRFSVIVGAACATLGCGGGDQASSGDAGLYAEGGSATLLTATGACHPGDTVACTCPGGPYSVQECEPEGGLGPCECGLDPLDPRNPHDAGAGIGADAAAALDASLGPGLGMLLLPAAKIVGDPTRELFYVSARANAPLTPSSVVAVPADGGAPSWSLAFDASPGPLGISDDGSKLYVGFPTQTTVRRIDLASRKVDLEIPLPANLGGAPSAVASPDAAYDVEAIPGSPRSCVVGVQGQGLAVFDDATMRPTTTFNYSVVNVVRMASATTGYGFDNSDTSADLWTLTLTSSGISLSHVLMSALAEFTPSLAYQGDLLYGWDGTVIDPVASHAVGHYDLAGPVVPNVPAGSTVVLTNIGTSSNPTPLVVAVYNRTSFARTATHTTAVVGSAYGAAASPSGMIGALISGTPPGRIRQDLMLVIDPGKLP